MLVTALLTTGDWTRGPPEFPSDQPFFASIIYALKKVFEYSQEEHILHN